MGKTGSGGSRPIDSAREPGNPAKIQVDRDSGRRGAIRRSLIAGRTNPLERVVDSLIGPRIEELDSAAGGASRHVVRKRRLLDVTEGP
jgi:hypothetical protein